MEYVDAQGVTHYVGSVEQIPPQYRERTEKPNLPSVNVDEGATVSSVARSQREAATARAQERAHPKELRMHGTPECMMWYSIAKKAQREAWQDYGERQDPFQEMAIVHPECMYRE